MDDKIAWFFIYVCVYMSAEINDCDWKIVEMYLLDRLCGQDVCSENEIEHIVFV